MSESVMRQGMESWLKSECANTGLSYIGIAEWIEGIAEEMALGHTEIMSAYANSTRELLGRYEERKLIEYGEGSEIMAVVEGAIGQNDFQRLSQYAEKLRIKALEKTVVCQIGERGYGKPRSDIERAMAHYGITEEEYLAHPEKYPLPERGAGLEEVKWTRFNKGQIVTIKPEFRHIYLGNVTVTVGADDPKYRQIWVKEVDSAVSYDHIEGV